jgi:hypothetical protein
LVEGCNKHPKPVVSTATTDAIFTGLERSNIIS